MSGNRKGDPGVPFFMPAEAVRWVGLRLGSEWVRAEPPQKNAVAARPSPIRTRASDGRSNRLGRLGDPVTLQALRTHPDALGRTLDQHPYGLQIRIPAPLGSIVGVADVVAGDRPLAAHGAYPGHELHPCETDGQTVGRSDGRSNV